jgi:trk system potassium uptake protein TrkA
VRILIIGAGEVGYHVAQRLALENKDVVVIDTSMTALKRVQEHLDVQTIEGSGSSPRLLEEAGIKSADIMLAVTDSDEVNLIACFFANQLAPHVTKVARIRNEEYTDFQQAFTEAHLNISVVINPVVEMVTSIVRPMSLPGAIEVNEFADGRIRIVGVRMVPGCPLDGVKLKNIREKVAGVGLVIAAVVHDNRLTIPTGQDTLRAEDIVYFVCEDKDIDACMHYFGTHTQPVKNLLIIGGGNIGMRLADALDVKDYHVKLIEPDRERSQELSAQLDRIIVLHGDGTDRELLEEENVSSMDVVIALTGDDETNILSCLLAKSLGAKRTIARINKFAYLPLMQTIGVDHFVSSRLSAIHSILHNIRRGKVISTISIKGEEAEAMEAIALEHSEIANKAVKDLEFPHGAIILSVLRGDEVILPYGDLVIRPQDRLIILAMRDVIPQVERKLMVKLEYF